ncbi:hypothetical protein [Halobaculum magnesiiphilum]|uniref:Uncharacterized protein n=1 Tax=Halobaculum magnesiiphilum TaxID=1017351 RepID=A0A8T8W9P2_9EURY|nr:hypothetical protein [Halobaculum magnesiiphilum]QZP36569.1 hypothetical protein K6T50_09595 [Halobaculum magnesiiphilum]
MRELDCDFCGGTAAGAYEVIPAELDPSPDEQARVVLCDSCRETLDDVLTPLLARLGPDDAAAAPSFAADAAGHSSPAADPNAGDDDTDSSDESVEFDDDSGIAIDIAGGTAAADESNPDPGAADAGDAEDDTADADASVDGADVEDVASGDADPTEESGSTNQPREEPPNFRKVMRFLNNREFPIARAEVAEFAAGAYDLEDEEVREIFEYAIERGILAEENGQLVKG